MSPLETLFRLEVEFHRRLRIAATGRAEASGIHTSYALQSGYEQLIGATGRVTAQEIERLRERFPHAGDSPDLVAARDSLRQVLGMH